MTATAFPAPTSSTSHSSVREKLFNIFVSPTDVFDEVIASPRNLANWRVPTLLVSLAGILSLQTGNFHTQSTATIRGLLEAGTISEAQAQALAGIWPLLSALLVGVGTFGATCWSAFVVWFIGRTFLKNRFPYLKALEIVGLTGIILVLGSIVTALVVAVSGDLAARPSLSLLAQKMSSSRRFYQMLETLNLFHLWSTTVLAIGLSRLCNVSFKEAA
ncbi:MAG TPA: YIP1 family protein, partial [Pirellulales bacterium]